MVLWFSRKKAPKAEARRQPQPRRQTKQPATGDQTQRRGAGRDRRRGRRPNGAQTQKPTSQTRKSGDKQTPGRTTAPSTNHSNHSKNTANTPKGNSKEHGNHATAAAGNNREHGIPAKRNHGWLGGLAGVAAP